MNANEVLRWLKRRGTRLTLRKRLGKDHPLSLALWETGCYEARLLAALVGGLAA